MVTFFLYFLEYIPKNKQTKQKKKYILRYQIYITKLLFRPFTPIYMSHEVFEICCCIWGHSYNTHLFDFPNVSGKKLWFTSTGHISPTNQWHKKWEGRLLTNRRDLKDKMHGSCFIQMIWEKIILRNLNMDGIFFGVKKLVLIFFFRCETGRAAILGTQSSCQLQMPRY